MKLSKSDLKIIIKECLVEIFQESLLESYKGKTSPVLKTEKITETYQPKKSIQQVPTIQKKVSPLDMKANPSILDLLADTAETTLKQQIAAEGRNHVPLPNSDRAARIAAQAEPDELFGEETASKWAELAFFDQKK